MASPHNLGWTQSYITAPLQLEVKTTIKYQLSVLRTTLHWNQNLTMNQNCGLWPSTEINNTVTLDSALSEMDSLLTIKWGQGKFELDNLQKLFQFLNPLIYECIPKEKVPKQTKGVSKSIQFT